MVGNCRTMHIHALCIHEGVQYNVTTMATESRIMKMITTNYNLYSIRKGNSLSLHPLDILMK